MRKLSFEEALDRVDAGAAFVDLRDVPSYLDVHLPGSLALVYEFGPGMAGRARDCIPLSVPLVLISDEKVNMLHAAASLRGKGFNVVGEVGDALNLWSQNGGKLASTPSDQGPKAPAGTILDVSDPGRRKHEGTVDVPIEHLWKRRHELDGEKEVTILCGKGVRAGLAVGMLEQIGIDGLRLWRNADRA